MIVAMDRWARQNVSDKRELRRESPLQLRLAQRVRAAPGRTIRSELMIGVLAGMIAVAIRVLIPLRPDQMPTLPAVVMLAIVTTFVGIWCGVATALVGGALSWYLFFHPYSWSFENGAWVPLFSYSVIAAVIVTTSYLYRSSERRRHEAELSRLQAQADNADLFAREMAHRLKNALAIVQSIAYQTIGSESAEAGKFASRLKALAEANELLSEDVRNPTADVAAVVEAALKPFSDEGHQFIIAEVNARIRSQQVISLALALHELATNAVKYGALSTAEGIVSITFERVAERLRMRWTERDGPTVKPPTQPGFGTRLLRRSGIHAKLDFQPEGLDCTIEIPVA